MFSPMRRFYLPAVLLLISFTGSVYASSKIPLSYVPKHVRNAIESYVPGSEITKLKITRGGEVLGRDFD
jgi:hypothetical protein